MNDNNPFADLVGYRRVSDQPVDDDEQIQMSDEQKNRAFALTLARPLLSTTRMGNGNVAPSVDALIKAAEWIISGDIIEPRYPFDQGDVTLLGPDIFATDDGKVICWKGQNYTIQEEADHYGVE